MSLPAVVSYLEKYKLIIKNNPLIATEIENALRWASYLVSGRFNSNLISELIYSLSSLLQLTNDVLLKKAFNLKSNLNEVVEKLKVFITIIEYTQVFFEISAKKIAGETGKWITITVIQITKAVIKLILLFKYNIGLQRQIPSLPLDRQRDVPSQGYIPPSVGDSDYNGQLEATQPNGITTMTLPRSGRIIRTLDNAPPRSKRTWILPTESTLINKILGKADKNAPPTQLNDIQKFAEVLHILRPVVHLSAMGTFGKDSWTSYLVPLGMDVTSIQLLNKSNTIWNTSERLELNQRSFSLFIYLMRSPFYDRFTKVKILRVLNFMADKIPLFGSLLRPFIQYLPEWQQTYFYIWNT